MSWDLGYALCSSYAPKIMGTFKYVPFTKRDMNSHGNIISFVMSQIYHSLVQIHTKFHAYFKSCTQVLFVFHVGT